MDNSALVPVFAGTIQNQPAQLCNARDLHTFLEVGDRFDQWIYRRIEQYGFADGEDFCTVLCKTSKRGGRPATDYHLTLDMAKELAMVENNAKGREVRRYFIACERRQAERLQQAAQSQSQSKALVHPNKFGIDPDIQRRINRRAWELAQAAYEDFRLQMMNDTLVREGVRPAEKWGPKFAQVEVINKAEAVASVCEGMSMTIRLLVKSLAGYADVDYDESTGKIVGRRG